MAAFHTCLTVGPIRLFISFFYHHKELHGPLDSAIWYRELSAMDLSARIFRPGFFGPDFSAWIIRPWIFRPICSMLWKVLFLYIIDSGSPAKARGTYFEMLCQVRSIFTNWLKNLSRRITES